jgi:hypothetical protein
MVDFGAFLEVFYNHRPAAGRGGVTMAQLQEAFAELRELQAAKGLAEGEGLPRELLLQLLQTQGEPLSGDELHVALAALAAGAGAGDDPAAALPEELGAQEYCSSVLGLVAEE